MTRYFCDDVSHWRDGQPRTVDVTAQVRLELGYVADREAYSADVHDVIDRVLRVTDGDRAGRQAEIRRVLTGSTRRSGAPVRLVDGTAGATTDVIRLPEASTPAADRGAVSTRTGASQITHANLTGTYAADDLAARLAAADPTPEALAEAIRRAPTYEKRTSDRVGMPWRVVIACPVLEGNPPVEHRVVFAGTGEAEQADVFGIPASNWDLALEASVSNDLAPSRGSRRAERLVGWLLLGEIAGVLILAWTAWISGGLGMAAREAPGWLLLAVILAVSAMGFAAVGLFGPRSPEGNVNDTLVVSRFYASRTEMLWIAAVVSIALFAASVAVAFAGPLSSDEGALPTPSVSFMTQGNAQAAVIDLDASGVGIDDRPTVTVRSFDARTGEGTTIGVVLATGTTDGRLIVHDVIGIPTGADFLAVLVSVGGNGPAACSPSSTNDVGCTLLAVPQAGATTSSIGASNTSTSTSQSMTVTSPSAAASASPSTTASIPPSTTTSISPSTTASISPSAPASVAPSPTVSIAAP